MSDSNNIIFNKQAKEYVPKKKREEKNNEKKETEIEKDTTIIKTNSEEQNKDSLQFNLKAKEYVPKTVTYGGYQVEGLDDDGEDEEVEDDVIDELVNQELDEPIDPMGDDEEESDDEKWFPKYKDCSCCKGYIYKCTGDVCTSLGVCFCKAQEDYDPEA